MIAVRLLFPILSFLAFSVLYGPLSVRPKHGDSATIAGPYTEYLKRQIERYKTGERAYSDKRMKRVIDTLRDEDIQGLLAYFPTRDD
jgi:cytochrome c553